MTLRTKGVPSKGEGIVITLRAGNWITFTLFAGLNKATVCTF